MTVLPPSARDAAGVEVPVSMSVSGDTLDLAVHHRQGEYRYPIAVDPTIVDKQLLDIFTPVLAYSNWSMSTNNSTAFRLEEESTQASDKYFSGVYHVADYGAFNYDTQRESKIYQFVSKTSSTSGVSDIKNLLTIAKGETTEASLELPANYASTSKTLCINSCAAPAAPQHNSVHFKQIAVKEGSSSFTAVISSAEVSITQEKSPTVSFDTTSPTIGGLRNALYNGNWVNSGGVVKLIATDPGLGVSETAFKWPGHTEAEWGYKTSYIYPTTFSTGLCNGVQCQEKMEDQAGPSKLAEGEDTIEATTADPVGLKASTTATVRYDNKAPTGVTISGLPESHEIGEGQYQLKLQATATDGNDAELWCGIGQAVY
jgi:hypothetical protein